jgi:hypothetical protein
MAQPNDENYPLRSLPANSMEKYTLHQYALFTGKLLFKKLLSLHSLISHSGPFFFLRFPGLHYAFDFLFSFGLLSLSQSCAPCSVPHPLGSFLPPLQNLNQLRVFHFFFPLIFELILCKIQSLFCILRDRCTADNLKEERPTLIRIICR